MRPPESFIGQPIRSLQTMLRVIAESEGYQSSVIPDGIYGQQTANAVSDFQRNYGLPVTGVANQATWDAIHAVYEPALVLVGEAQPLNIILEPLEVIGENQFHPNLFVVQGILNVFALAYAGILAPELTGRLDIPTVQSLSAFQELSGLPVTGTLDKQTWRHLALQYPTAAMAVKYRE